MTKQEQIGYIIQTPMEKMDWGAITETFTKQEKQYIILNKFYAGDVFNLLSELAEGINGIYGTLATLTPIQNLQHLEPLRKNYMDIKVLSDFLK